MTAAHWRWIITRAVVVTALINLVVNGALAWISSRGQRVVAIWSPPFLRPSTVTDTLGTLFLLPLVTTVMCSLAVRRDTHRGTLPRLEPGSVLVRVVDGAPAGLLRRAVVLGATSVLTLGPIATALIAIIHFGDIRTMTFVLYKAILGVTLGLAITPIVAAVAMADREPSRD